MPIDLERIAQLGGELGLEVRRVPLDQVDLVLEPGVVLVFRNLSGTADSLAGFEGFGWHFHGELEYVDRRGRVADLGYLDVLTGLVDGRVLVCERVMAGRISDLWLVHRDGVDEFAGLHAGEEIRVRRIASRGRLGPEAPTRRRV